MLDSTPGLIVTEVAGSAGLSPHTLHYYERIGLLEQSPVAATATVAYGESDLMWIAFFAQALRARRPGGATAPNERRRRRVVPQAERRGVRQARYSAAKRP